VGFRPFVYRLATELGLRGSVLNSSAGLMIEVEGPSRDLQRFQERLDAEKPAAAVVLARESSRLAPLGYDRFEIRPSDAAAEKTASVLPDLATCPDCRDEVFDAGNRRHRYPFTNCTNCGPRYTILEDIPYDRPSTTMRSFTMCAECAREYAHVADRRFHAQPNACSACGPRIGETSIEDGAAALRRGEIVALKGVGGFQLLVDARNQQAVGRLRDRKYRDEKPFAVMMASMAMVREYAIVSEAEQRLLESSAAPIVLMEPKAGSDLAPNVSAHSPHVGIMLPYSPLHHLLMRECGFPIVATSGNRSEEPIAIDNDEARERLGTIADVFVMHDRPIARPCDDSVVRVCRGRESVIRRARGYAPLPVRADKELPPVLAVGGHLKNTVAIAIGRDVFVSQHVGDLETLESRQGFERAIEDLCALFDFKPQFVACDLHPDYASTQWARRSGLPVVTIQHHHAHVAACAAENHITGPYLGVAWDGTGYGLDGTVWGGEFFLVDGRRIERVAHLRPFRLPGGDAAAREGWRSAASLKWEVFGPAGIDPLVRQMLSRGVNAPLTTSVGRLFDAVAAISGVADRNLFEGHAAMRLERAIGPAPTSEAYPLPGGDWEPLIRQLRSSPDGAAARFHNALVQWLVEVARSVRVGQVVLSGGVFQNRYLVERAVAELEVRGFAVYTHQRVPTNDGGIALGQAVLAAESSICA
jgi:hydrogenase maturation protein HypF